MKKVKDEVLVIQGSGGGSGKKQHTPVEEPNTLRSKVRARILDLVAYGPIKGLVNGLRSVYLDGTPVENADGTLNFQGITVTTREGYPDQTYIPGFRSVENTSEVNTEIKQATPVIRSMTNNDADAAAVTIQLASLYKQENNGDTVGTTVEVFIDVRKDGGAWQQAVAYTFQGKTTAPYPKTFRIDLKPYGKGSFDLRVRRNSKESETSKLADKMTWTLLTEIIDRRFSHPNMAMVGIEVDSELFGAQMPARVYHMDLSITQVPSNWDPYTRAYTGIWDGTFKDSWHDNPAWAYYDLAMHPVIGAGLDVIDKWELYRIAQFCDELVPNGYGGMEPRFTINTVFADQEDATVALNTLATIFRGMTYWGSNTVVPVADMPENPVLTVGPSSVKDGDFARTGTSMRERHSVAIVMWNDPDDMGRAVPEIYEDPDSLAEFGWRETRVTAVACNSRGQARRMAMWILDSERYETQTLSYTGTTEHAFLRPGNIIEVADPFEQGARMSGRLLERSTNQVTVDKVPADAVAQVGGQWWLSVMLPDLTLSRHRVSSFDGDVIHLLDPLLTLPVVGAIWGLYSAGLQLPHYRVVSNSEDSATGMFQVTATEYDINKYSRVEQGLILPERPISLLPNGPLPAPTNLEFKVYTYYAGTARQQGLLISFEPPSDVRIDSFVIDVKSPSDASYRTVYNGPGTSFDMTNAEAGQWTVRVRSTASTGKLSQWTARTVQISQLLLPTPPDSVNVAVATFSVTLTPLSAYTDAMWEFWRSLVPLTAQQIEANAQQLPTGQYLVDADLKPDTQYYYYVRGVNQYGKSNWFGVQAKTLNNFDDILEAVTEDIKEGILYQYFEEKIDTKAAQVAIDKANEVVNGALTEVNQSIADLNATVDQVGSTVTTGLADANTAIQAVKTQADGIRADVDANVASVTGTLQSIMSNVGTLQSETNTLKTSMTSVQGSITAINTTTGGLRTDLNALQTSVSTQVSGLQAQLDAASSAREYNKANAYTAGQFISVGRSLYQAKIAVPAKADGTNAPPNATYWRDAGSVVASADGLATRVTTAETNIGTINGTLTSQATTISGIQTTLNGKADSSALTALTSRVTAAENTITSQGSAITSLTNTVAGKADASALTALTTRVTSAEGTLTSLGNSLTTVQATLGNIAGNGSNLVPSEYSWLSAAVPTIAMSPVTPVVSEADATVPSGYRYKITRGNASNPWTMFCKTNNAAGWNTTLTAGTYIVSFYANTNAAGVTNGLKARSAVWDGTSRGTTDFTVTATRTRYSHLVTLAADTVGALTIFLPAGAVGDLLWVDSLMIERQIAGGTVPSAFVAGPTGSEITGLATAQTALEARVTAAEGVNTSQATSITNLNSSLAGKADASALTALTTRVTAAEGVNTSQGDSITSLTNTVNGKADASALTALTTRVTAAEGTISSQGSAITNLTNAVAGKADVSALNALTTRVTAAEGSITSQGTSITSLTASIGNVASENLLLDPTFANSTGLTNVAGSVAYARNDAAVPAGAPSSRVVKIPVTSTSNYYCGFTSALNVRTPENGNASQIAVQPGEVYDFELYSYVAANRGQVGIWVQFYDAAGVSTGHNWAVQSGDGVNLSTTVGQWVKLTGQGTVPANCIRMAFTIRYSAAPATDAYIAAPVVRKRSAQANGQATAQTALEARVTAAEGVNTSQATSITNLNTSLSGKADASALTALTTRVSAAEGTISSQGSSITSLTNSLAGKADVSALNALTTRVTAAEGTLTALSSSVTTVQATLGNIAGSGVNLLPSEYSWLTSTTLPTMTSSLSNRSGVAVAGSPSGFGYYLQATSNSLFSYMVMAPSNAVANYNLSLEAGTYLVSMYVKGDTAGQVMANLYDGTNSRSATLAYTTARQRLTFVINLPAAAQSALLIYPNRQGAATAGITVDSIMIERRVGENNTPSTFVPGPSASEVAGVASATTALEARVTAAEGVNTSQATSITNLNSSLAGKADASALTALTTRVTAAEGVNTSQGSSITSLTASMDAIGGAGTNLLPAEYTAYTATLPVTSTNAAYSVAVEADAAAFNGFALKLTTNNTTNGTIYLVPSAAATVGYSHANMGFKRGKYVLSYYARTNVAGHVISPFLSSINTAGARINSNIVNQNQALTTDWARYSAVIDMTSASHVGDLMLLCIQLNVSVTSGRIVWLDKVMIEPMIGANTDPSPFVPGNSLRQTAALASAQQALDTRVTAAEGTITSQGSSITNLNNSLANKADASALTALTTRVTAAEGVNTSQGTSITNLTNSLAGKADASALTALTTRVTAAEGAITSQGNSITTLTSMIGQQPDNLILKGTFEDGDIGPWTASPLIANVTAHASYSKAIQFMANSFCGITFNVITRGGEEFDCSADIWNNYMTAGQTARLQMQFYDKAGTNLGYFTAFTAYAGATGFQTYSGRITAPVGSVTARFVVRHETSDGTGRSLWCNIQARRVSMADSANAAATTALTTRVTSAEGTLTSQGSSITSLSSSINAIGGSGANLIPAEYASFTSTLPAIQRRGTTTVVAEAYTGAYQTHRLKVSDSTTDGNGYFCLYANNETLNIRLKPSTKYIFSAWAQCGGANRLVRLRHRYVGADGVQVEAHLANINLTTTWGRVSATFTTPAALVDRAEFLIFTTPAAGSQDCWWDGFMVEEQIGNSTTPSSWVSGPAVNAVAAQAAATSALDTRLTAAEGSITSQGTAITNLTNTVSGKADASALTALTTRVTAAEGNISSLSSSVTSLSSTLGGISGNGSNLVPSQYSWLTSLTAPTMAASAANREGVAVTGAVSGFGLKLTATSASNGVYAMLAPSNNAAGWNIQLEPGTYIVSFYGSSSNGSQLQVSMYDGAQRYTPTFNLTTTRTRYSGVITVTAATKAAFTMFFNRNAVNGTDATIDSPMIERQIAGGTVPSSFVAGPTASEVTGLATAQQALDTRVTAVEGVNTSQATSITNLNTSVAGKADSTALTALTTRVTAAEGTITSQGSSITNLTAGLNSIGGDNMLPNSSFETLASATMAEWWTTAGTTAGIVNSIVSSDLTQSSKAQRVDHTGIAVNGYLEVRGVNSASARLKVKAGASYVLSSWARGTPGMVFRQYISFYNAAGGGLGTPTSAGVLSDEYGRFTLNVVAPATAATCLVYAARIINSGTATAPLWMEVDNVQLQEGTVATAYTPGVEVGLAGAAAATSALGTRMTSAEGLITSQGSSITSLTNSLAGKADASALNSLTTRVTAAEGSITSQGNAVTALQTSLGNIGGTGSNLNPSEYSVFGPNAPTIGATSSGLTVSTVADGATLGGYALKFVSSNTTTTLACYLHSSNTVAAVGSFPMAYSPGKYIISFYAKANVAGRTIKAWLRALNSADAVVAPTAPTFTLTTDWVRYSAIMDLSNATTYSGSRMVFSLNPNNSGVSGTEIYLDRIMVEQQIGSNTTPSAFDGGTSYTQAQAQASAISSLDTRVTSAEGVNTAQATSISSLTTRMGSAESSITTTANSLASTNGTLSSMWAMKINTAVGGKRYVAGMGVSMVTAGGITQSEILFQADRFALINSASGAITVPFFIENGVTYIQSAMIKQATIVNAIIGADLTSAAYTTWGGPVMSINFNVGQIVTRHPTSVNTYSVMNQNGMYVVVNGVLRVRMGVW